MKLLRVLHALLPSVEVRLIKHLSTDIRDPRVVHKARRRRECAKVAVARPYWPEVPSVLRRQAD
jgi:hypothetical protein